MATYTATVVIDYPVAAGGPGVNVWHFRTAPDISDDNQLDNASDRLEDFYTAIRAIYPSGTTVSFDGEWVPTDSDDDGGGL